MCGNGCLAGWQGNVRRWYLVMAVGAVGLLAGCGGSGPTRYHVSGTVTFNGQPVPAGSIVFEPDTTAGNTGPQGRADISDGKFDTQAGGRGTVGGAHLARISGHEKRAGNVADEIGEKPPLFSDYLVKVDLPKQNSKQDFQVPADAAKPKPGLRQAPQGP